MSAPALFGVALGAGRRAAVQGVCGFGFALVAAPLLAAVLRPEEALALLAFASLAVSGTVLVAAPPSPVARRRRAPAASVGPGRVPLGALLWLAPGDRLRVLVCLAALGIAAVLLRPAGERR